MFTIYKYTNRYNGKIYIGQTKLSLEERAQSNGNNYKECPRFYSDIKKYGWDAFDHEILDTTDTRKHALELEHLYISLYKSDDANVGYNISGGVGEDYVAKETREIISANAKMRYKDPTNNPMYGRRHSEDSLRKMSECKKGSLNPMYGKKWTDKQRESCGTKGKKLNITDDQRQKMRDRCSLLGKSRAKPCRCVEDDIVFSSAKRAAAHYGVATGTLNGHLKGRQLSCAGKHFEYV